MIRPCIFMGLSMLAMVSQAAECSRQNPERFVDFLPTFSDSKGFALQRTVLPLPLLEWHEGLDSDGRQLTGPRKSFLSTQDYGRWPTMNRFMRERELLSNVRSQTRTAAIIDVYKEGSAGLVSFHFKSEAGCWRLWQYEVRSQ